MLELYLSVVRYFAYFCVVQTEYLHSLHARASIQIVVVFNYWLPSLTLGIQHVIYTASFVITTVLSYCITENFCRSAYPCWWHRQQLSGPGKAMGSPDLVAVFMEQLENTVELTCCRTTRKHVDLMPRQFILRLIFCGQTFCELNLLPPPHTHTHTQNTVQHLSCQKNENYIHTCISFSLLASILIPIPSNSSESFSKFLPRWSSIIRFLPCFQKSSS